MTYTASDNTSRDSVELSESEYREVHSLLRMCLAAEMGIDGNSVVDDQELVHSCERILNGGGEDSVHASDMKRGFVPLFARLNEAGKSPLATNSGIVYRIEFR